MKAAELRYKLCNNVNLCNGAYNTCTLGSFKERTHNDYYSLFEYYSRIHYFGQ